MAEEDKRNLSLLEDEQVNAAEEWLKTRILV